MIASSIFLCFLILGEAHSHRPRPPNLAFANRVSFLELKKAPFVNKNNVLSVVAADADETLLAAEEAAAFDAHDASDPGMEGAAMERSVMMAAGLLSEERETMRRGRSRPSRKPSFLRRIRSLFRHDDENEEEGDDAGLLEALEAEARYARGLADIAAIEHANEESATATATAKTGRVRDAVEAEARYAHYLADVAAIEHVNEETATATTTGRVRDAVEAEARYARHLADVAAIEHVNEETVMATTTGRVRDAVEAEARYARHLADVAAIEHADERPTPKDGISDEATKEKTHHFSWWHNRW